MTIEELTKMLGCYDKNRKVVIIDPDFNEYEIVPAYSWATEENGEKKFVINVRGK